MKEEQSNIKGNKYIFIKKTLSYFAKFIALIAAIMGIIGGGFKVYDYFFTDPNIGYCFAKYKVAKAYVYSGELINDSSTHANNLTLKGKFSSKVIDIDVITGDILEKKEINNPNGTAEFSLNRLSKKSRCIFDIIVIQESEISEQVQVSWGEKGKLMLNPQASDEKIKKGIQLGEKLSGLDLSRKTRHKWLEDNSKNIR